VNRESLKNRLPPGHHRSLRRLKYPQSSNQQRGRTNSQGRNLGRFIPGSDEHLREPFLFGVSLLVDDNSRSRYPQAACGQSGMLNSHSASAGLQHPIFSILLNAKAGNWVGVAELLERSTPTTLWYVALALVRRERAGQFNPQFDPLCLSLSRSIRDMRGPLVRQYGSDFINQLFPPVSGREEGSIKPNSLWRNAVIANSPRAARIRR
jgi:hypothetical protein